MKLLDEIEVTPAAELCTWKIDTSRLAYDAKLVVGMGCQAMYIVNGSLANVFDAGRYVINPKRERKEGNSIALIGVNRNKNFTLAWGVGGIPYRDKKSRLETEIGLNGEYTIQLLQPGRLYAAFGKEEIAPKEIALKTRAKLTEMLKSELGKRLSGYSYFDISSTQGEISKMIEEAFKEVLFDFGVSLKSFALKEIYFPDEFKRKIKEWQEKEDDLDAAIRRQDEEKAERIRQRREMEAVEKLIGKAEPSGTSDAKAAQVKCPVCGTLCVDGAVFCPKCGKKL